MDSPMLAGLADLIAPPAATILVVAIAILVALAVTDFCTSTKGTRR